MALLWQKGNKKGAEEAPKADKKKAVAKVPAKKVEKAEKKAESKGEKRAAAAAGVVFPKGSAVIRPRVTEKAGLLSEKGIYTFEVQVGANTREIAKVIEATYKVTPVRISVAPIKSKAMFVRGKSGRTVAGKKAYVYLKDGDKIEFI